MDSPATTQLKNVLAEEYKILDKRIKHLEKVNVFAVDDRHSSDVGADKDFLSPFCAVLAHIKSTTEIEVTLSRNVPLSPVVEQWIAKAGASYNGKCWPTARLSILLSPGDQDSSGYRFFAACRTPLMLIFPVSLRQLA